MTDPLLFFPVVCAEGAELELADGRRLVDGMSFWWAAGIGCVVNAPKLFNYNGDSNYMENLFYSFLLVGNAYLSSSA